VNGIDAEEARQARHLEERMAAIRLAQNHSPAYGDRSASVRSVGGTSIHSEPQN